MQARRERLFKTASAFASAVLLTSLLQGCGGGGGAVAVVTPPPPPPITATTYANPLTVKIAAGGQVESCADPSIIRNDADASWYMYCTADPLNDQDKDAQGNWRFRAIPILKSADLATWTYMGDALAARPAWVASNSGYWAPAIKRLNNKFYLYYAVPNSSLPGNGSAIGVATSNSPAGPWTDSGSPVVGPKPNRSMIDPDVIEDNGKKYIYYGSFDGGIFVRALSDDGLVSDAATEQQIAIGNRYEAPYVVKHGNYFYLFLSASNCCNGPLSGYAVYAGRATTPLGPFVDKDGISLVASRAGGTLVLAMNGNQWVGPGHNAVFTDMAGQDWTIYHAIDRNYPYYAGAPGYTKRPVMMDAIDWVNEWPVVTGGPSNTAQALPAAQPGDRTLYTPKSRTDDAAGQALTAFSDEFNGAQISAQWSWIRQPSPGSYRLDGSALQIDTQTAELYGSTNNAPVLVETAPAGDFIVEAKMRFNVPASGCCQNFSQAGLVVYADDDNYVKLVHASMWETRQIEFGKEVSPVPAGYPSYGSTLLESPDDWTWLRIVKRVKSGGETYTAYSSRDGLNWSRGGTWTHTLGQQIRIGLVSMNTAGFTASFDYVHVYALGN